MAHDRLIKVTVTMPAELVDRIDAFDERHCQRNPGDVPNRSRCWRFLLTNSIAGVERTERQQNAGKATP